MVALQGHGALAVDVDRRHRGLVGAGQRDADVSVLGLAGAVDDATHDGHIHVFHARVPRAPDRHLLTQVALDAVGQFLEEGAAGAAAARAGHHHGGERAQAQRLQDLLSDHHFLAAIAARLGRERDADGVADALLQQQRQRGGRGHDALAAHAGLGQAHMQRVVTAAGQFSIDGYHVLHVGDLGRQHDGVAGKANAFCLLGAFDGRGDKGLAHDGLGVPGLGVCRVGVHQARQHGLVKRAPVDTDAHRLAVAAGGLDHGAVVVVALGAAAHVARVDAVLGQCLGTLGEIVQQLVAVVVEVAHQRHLAAHAIELFTNGGNFGCGGRGVDGDADQLGAGLGQRAGLDGRGDGLGGVGVGHRLHDHRPVAADQDLVVIPAHHHLAGAAALSGAYRHGIGMGGRGPFFACVCSHLPVWVASLRTCRTGGRCLLCGRPAPGDRFSDLAGGATHRRR